jgi:hypothetical protein
MRRVIHAPHDQAVSRVESRTLLRFVNPETEVPQHEVPRYSVREYR